MQIRVTSDFDKLVTAIGDVGARHIPRATALALTRTAMDAKEELIGEMQRDFDRPTSFTLNSLWVEMATKTNPVAVVKVKENAPKGTPAIKYLAPEIYGGGRRIKRFERALQAAGLMPSGMYAMPGAACPLDGYGNVSPAFIVRMMSQLRAFGEQGYRANETDRGKARRLAKDRRLGDWLVIREQRGKLKPGIYQRYHFGMGNTLKPIFIFTRKAPSYSKRFSFFETVEATVSAKFPTRFAEAFGQQLGKWGA